MNAWNLYGMSRDKEDGHPEVGFGERAKIYSEEWKKMTTDDKKPFVSSSNDDKIRYQKEFANMANFKKAIIRKNRREEFKARKSSNCPKRVLTPYIKYLKSNHSIIAKATPGIKFGDVSKEMSKQWKALSVDERAPWEANYAEETAAYHKHVAEFKNEKKLKKAANREARIALQNKRVKTKELAKLNPKPKKKEKKEKKAEEGKRMSRKNQRR